MCPLNIYRRNEADLFICWLLSIECSTLDACTTSTEEIDKISLCVGAVLACLYTSAPSAHSYTHTHTHRGAMQCKHVAYLIPGEYERRTIIQWMWPIALGRYAKDFTIVLFNQRKWMERKNKNAMHAPSRIIRFSQSQLTETSISHVLFSPNLLSRYFHWPFRHECIILYSFFFPFIVSSAPQTVKV